MPARLVVDPRGFLPLLLLAASGASLIWLRRPALTLALAGLLLLLHLFVLPWLARRWRTVLDRSLLLTLQQRQPERMRRIFRRAWLVRLYAPDWYIDGKEAFICMELEEYHRAEQLYLAAIPLAPEPEKSTFLANLSVIAERLGKSEEAARLRRRLADQRPDLAELLAPPTSCSSGAA